VPALVAYLESPEREFARAGLGAEQRLSRHLPVLVEPWSTAEHLLWIVRRYPPRYLSRVVLLCHGAPTWLGQSGGRRGWHSSEWRRRARGGLHVEALALALGPRLTEDARVGLAACSAGRDPGVAGGWGAAAYRDGGARSIAAVLRDLLVQHAPNVVVRAHTTRGHATRNPACREFSPIAGQAGASIMRARWGDDYVESGAGRRQWAAQFGGSFAEAWIAGNDVSAPRPRHSVASLTLAI
jgi:hypothetical protein